MNISPREALTKEAYDELVDRLGQRTRIRFTALERNVKLAADTFKFKIPPNTDVVGDTQ